MAIVRSFPSLARSSLFAPVAGLGRWHGQAGVPWMIVLDVLYEGLCARDYQKSRIDTDDKHGENCEEF
jgi:hypothetical protein